MLVKIIGKSMAFTQLWVWVSLSLSTCHRCYICVLPQHVYLPPTIIFSSYSIVLDSQGGIYTFGDGRWGALGHGDFTSQRYPMRVMEFGKSTSFGVHLF